MKYKLLICLVISCSLFEITQSLEKQGTVIVLQGTSSAGKTSIMKCLQQLFHKEKLIILSLDDFLWKIVIEHNINSGLISESMPLDEKQKIIMLNWHVAFEKIIKNNWLEPQQELHKAIREAALQGLFVLVDTVHENEETYASFCEQNKGLDVMIVQVYCPLPKLIEHVIQRNSKVEYCEKRDLFWILKQYSDLYQYVESADDCIDIMTMYDIENSLDIVHQDLHNTMNENVLDKKISEMKSYYKKLFHFHTSEKIFLISKLPYDFLVHTGSYSAEICAQLIYEKYNLSYRIS